MRYSTRFHHGRGRRRDGFGVALIAVVAVGAVAGVTAAAVVRDGGPAAAAMAPPESHGPDGALRRSFGFCHTGGGIDCVVDGDTFWIDGEKIRIADIDAPETHPPRCPREAELGDAATRRLQALLNAGPVTLAVADRDTDRYGRKLRVVMRGSRSIGAMLVDEGLARRWTGHREPWC